MYFSFWQVEFAATSAGQITQWDRFIASKRFMLCVDVSFAAAAAAAAATAAAASPITYKTITPKLHWTASAAALSLVGSFVQSPLLAQLNSGQTTFFWPIVRPSTNQP
jgi:hypothetical protein